MGNQCAKKKTSEVPTQLLFLFYSVGNMSLRELSRKGGGRRKIQDKKEK